VYNYSNSLTLHYTTSILLHDQNLESQYITNQKPEDAKTNNDCNNIMTKTLYICR